MSIIHKKLRLMNQASCVCSPRGHRAKAQKFPDLDLWLCLASGILGLGVPQTVGIDANRRPRVLQRE